MKCIWSEECKEEIVKREVFGMRGVEKEGEVGIVEEEHVVCGMLNGRSVE